MSAPILLSLLAALFVAFIRVALRTVMRENEDTLTVCIFYNVGAGILLLFIFGLPTFSTLSLIQILLLFLSGITWAIAGYFDTRSFVDLDASVNALLSALRYVLLVGASILCFSEQLRSEAIYGVILIFCSMLLTCNFKDAHFRRGVYFRLIAIMFINGGILLDKYLTTIVPVSLVVICSYLLPGVLVIALSPRRCRDIPALIKRNGAPLLCLIPLQAGIYASYVYAFASGELIIASTVFQSSIVLTFLVEVVFEKKHDNLLRRANAALGCSLGVLLVTM